MIYRNMIRGFHLKGVRPTGITLGRGSYGEVIEVEWCGTLCAAKRMHDIFLKDLPRLEMGKMVGDFEKECQTWSILRHPNIVQLLGSYYPVGSPVPTIVLEKMDTSLRHYLEDHSKEEFLLPDKVSILHQVAQGLCYLHSHNPPLVHHDLSPSNILLSRGLLQTKLTDFGMTRAVNPSKLTRRSSVKGTQAFMPPEALDVPPRYNEKLDVFSFGNCITTTLTHEWPNPSHPTAYDKGRAILRTEFERRRRQIGLLSAREEELFLSLIKRCLEGDATIRPSSAEIVSEVKQIASTLQSTEPSATSQVQQAMSQLSLERQQKTQLQQQLDEERQQHQTQLAQFESDVSRLQNEIVTATSEKEALQTHIQLHEDKVGSTQPSKMKMYRFNTKCIRTISDGEKRKFYIMSVNKNGFLAVADQLNNCICLFDSNGTLGTVFQVKKNGKMETFYTGIEFTTKNNIAIADCCSKRILIYTIKGEHIRTIVAKSETYGVAVNKRGIYFCEAKRKCVSVYSEEGEFQFEFGTAGSGHGQFVEPVSVAFGPDGLLYVVDASDHTIQVFTELGTFVRQFKVEIGQPDEICIGNDGYVLISFPYSNEIGIFYVDGQLLHKIAFQSTPGSVRLNEKGEIMLPDGENSILVCRVYWNF